MLPVTSLLPVRTARGNVVYMAAMQPILGGTSDDPIHRGGRPGDDQD